jgi:hypothetical protein
VVHRVVYANHLGKGQGSAPFLIMPGSRVRVPPLLCPGDARAFSWPSAFGSSPAPAIIRSLALPWSCGAFFIDNLAFSTITGNVGGNTPRPFLWIPLRRDVLPSDRAPQCPA